MKIQALTRKEQDLHDWEKLISAETRLVTGNVQENVPPQAYLEKEGSEGFDVGSVLCMVVV